MNFLFLSLIIFICILLFSFVVLGVRYRKLKNTFRNHKNVLRNILKTVNSVRYGNLFERVNDDAMKVLPNFGQSINSMIDAISDREDMIKEYQADLNKKIEALKEVEQLKEDFVATLTHDLKVPIMAEKNLLAFLLDNKFGDLNEKQKEAVVLLKNSNQELVELVEIILETYKLNETEIVLSKEPVCVKDLIEETIIEMKPISDSDDININFDFSSEKDAGIDKFYIKRVLKNLILNAISFSEPGSNIDISLSNDENYVYINITNYGKSIKPEEIEHIFDKYYTTAKKFRKVGTGLGLYLSDKIIKAHSGKIDIESQKDTKTTFTVVLPV